MKRHDLGDCKVRLEVTVPKSLQELSYQNCLEGFAEKAQIPGFSYKKGGGRKKGDDKLPPANVIVNFVGEKEFKSACVEEMLQQSIPQAMQTVASVALQDSERIETPFDELFKAFSGKDASPVGDVIYGISCEVVPTITWNGDYRKLKVEVTAPSDDVDGCVGGGGDVQPPASRARHDARGCRSRARGWRPGGDGPRGCARGDGRGD